jgi:hypothetical protein
VLKKLKVIRGGIPFAMRAKSGLHAGETGAGYCPLMWMVEQKQEKKLTHFTNPALQVGLTHIEFKLLHHHTGVGYSDGSGHYRSRI